MLYRDLGRTGLKVSELCLGTLTFGAEADARASAALYRRSRDAGINFIDTADCYADGRSEETLGTLLGRDRSEIILATKVYFPAGDSLTSMGLSRARIARAVEASLKRLRTDYIDLYYVHYFDPATPLDETLGAMGDLVRQGKVRHLGVSNWAAWQVSKALAVSDRAGAPRFACLQPMYNLVKRQVQVELLPLAQAESLAVVPYGALAGGLLSGKYGTHRKPAAGRLMEKETYIRRYADPANLDAADRLAATAADHGVHPATLAVAWVKSHPGVTSTLIGARSLEQLEPQLAAVDFQGWPGWRPEVSCLSPEPPPATDRSEEVSEDRAPAAPRASTSAGAGGRLSEVQLNTFEERGFLGPFEFCPPEEMKELWGRLQPDILGEGKSDWMRHLDHRPTFEVCSSPRFLNLASAVLGKDLLLWRSRYFVKQPGAREIPWHQDSAYLRAHLHPVINVSFWMALDDVDRMNSCVRLIPGSHHRNVPHVDSEQELDPAFALKADPKEVQESQCVHMEMKAGQFFMFDASMLHGSAANASGRRRAGLAVRFTIPAVKITTDPGDLPVLVRGVDRHGLNVMAQAPASAVRIG